MGKGPCPPSDPRFVPPQGEWRPQQIDNPDYKGKWVHPEIDNPEYSPDPLLYSYDSFGVIGLDLWQVRGAPGRLGGGPRELQELPLSPSLVPAGEIGHHL